MIPVHAAWLILLPLLGGAVGAGVALAVESRRARAAQVGPSEAEYLSALSRLEARSVKAARSLDEGFDRG